MLVRNDFAGGGRERLAAWSRDLHALRPDPGGAMHVVDAVTHQYPSLPSPSDRAAIKASGENVLHGATSLAVAVREAMKRCIKSTTLRADHRDVPVRRAVVPVSSFPSLRYEHADGLSDDENNFQSAAAADKVPATDGRRSFASATETLVVPAV